jgi:regulatory NSL complex subunit 3
MMNCVDQMFVMARNKIQDIRLDYPGRNIVLVGFGFGATLALQIAQVEQVLCVISIGFSLLTAEGKRGEPDDNLLELQCPVLFVIGQCSSTSVYVSKFS